MTSRFDSEIYYCHQCKTKIYNLTDLLFVEDKSSRGFCSEECIEEFFLPLSQHYQNILTQLRKDLHLEKEECLELESDVHIVSKTCSSPDEIWCQENRLGDQLYSFISYLDSKEEQTYHIVLCFVFQKSPSYILVNTVTSSKLLIERFRIGEKIDDIDEFISNSEEMSEIGVTDEMIAELERKKSSYLAELMSHQLPSDIQCENFHLYESYFGETLEGPDEVYLFNDDEGDQVFTHIKAFEKSGQSFYYLIVFLSYATEDIETKTMLPIISFPTLDGNLCNSYRKGEMVLGNLKS